MLEELEVRDLGPIHHALLKPATGMTAITGETGAGKSMLLNAIRLLSGVPARGDLVSPGSKEAWVQGIFTQEEGAPVLGIIDQAGLPAEDDGQIFISRSIPVGGRSRAAVNGRSAPRSLLEGISSDLVTVHGQTDQMRMANPGRQRDFLDAYAQDEHELAEFRLAWSSYQSSRKRLDSLRNQEAGLAAQADYLRESIDRIDQVDPHPGEDEDLHQQRDRIEHAAQISQGLRMALGALDAAQVDPDGDGPSVSGLLEQAISALEGIGIGGVFQESARRLRSMNTDLSDLVFTLSSEMDDEVQEGDLDKINARIHDLGELTRRWGPTIDDVLAWRDKSRLDLEDMDASPEKLQELQDQCSHDRDAALKAARALSRARATAGHTLGDRVSEELESLAMAGAGLEVKVVQRDDDALDQHGLDDISFLFTPYPGSPQLPMGKSASGGELSRLMLAMELVAAEARTAGMKSGAGNGQASDGGGDVLPNQNQAMRESMTFIFDEVDAGVGGRAAVELGRRLARLAVTSQVIVVTHLPQVASWADAQFVVSKHDGQPGGVETVVDEVAGETRQREIARMLSGSESTTSLEHARELLDSSRL